MPVARKKKSETSVAEDANANADEIVDAEVLEETATSDAGGVIVDTDSDPSSQESVQANGSTSDESESSAVQHDAEDNGRHVDDETEVGREDPGSEAESALGDPVGHQESDPTDAPAADTPLPTDHQPTNPSSGGFFPLLLGGVIAAGIGYAAATWDVLGLQTDNDAALAEAVAAQANQVAALEDQLNALRVSVDELAARPDTASEIAALRAELDGRPETTTAEDFSALEAEVAALGAELRDVADRPVVASSDLAGDQMEALQSQIDAAIGTARSELESARAEAARIEADAKTSAQLAAAEAALAQVSAALEGGTPFAEPLATVAATGVAIPQSLAEQAESGVPALPGLQAEFPDAARAALEASIRSEQPETATGRAMAFLRAQTGARSLTPRDGSDPDAVLSRAEAALRNGDLTTVLAELSGLPETGLDAMSAWHADAGSRQAALHALDELRVSVETN